MEKGKEKKTYGIIGLVIGVVSLLFSTAPFINNISAVLAIIGLVLGIIGLVINRKNKKLLSLLASVISVLAFAIVLYSQNQTSKAIKDSVNSTQSTPKKTSKTKDLKVGDTISLTDVDIKITNYSVIPVGQKGNEYGEKPVIAFWYDVTNKTDKDINPSSAWIAAVDAYQDTSKTQVNRLDMANLPDDQYLDTQSETIKKNATASSAVAYSLDDDSTPVDVKITKGYDGDLLAEGKFNVK
ncbi:DUF5067 domain-containing protein [Weissella confusa]|uniref:DUF5067 domain-containing protein n=1 Tax=Weissella confusa TaxID=1583 RepID=UPI001C6FC636|nr:DUF5067 domain-containing protein [Weissella confusa]QYU58165.1 DUF5067 domain-containing protein [Weissella confusa]